MANLDFKINYKRKLPHIQQKRAIYSICFRLAFSLPETIRLELRQKKINYEITVNKLKGKELADYKEEFSKKYFEYFDDFLGRYNSFPLYLQNDSIAKIVADSILFWNEKRYKLYAYSIMPNHVHLIIRPLLADEKSFFSLSKILHSLKRYTGYESNKILGREGQFWQHESYDHQIRDERDFNHQFLYLINNPVKAGLVSVWEKWEYTWQCLI